jgi:hypothetical protein
MQESEFTDLPNTENERLHTYPLLKLSLCQFKERVLGIKQVAMWNW